MYVILLYGHVAETTHLAYVTALKVRKLYKFARILVIPATLTLPLTHEPCYKTQVIVNKLHWTKRLIVFFNFLVS